MQSLPGSGSERESLVINSRSSIGYTPFLEAASRGAVENVKFFVSHGADPSVVSKRGESALHIAADRNHREIVEFLLSEQPEMNGKQVPLNVHSFFMGSVRLSVVCRCCADFFFHCLLLSFPCHVLVSYECCASVYAYTHVYGFAHTTCLNPYIDNVNRWT